MSSRRGSGALPPLPSEWKAGLRPTHVLLGLFMLVLGVGFVAGGVGAVVNASPWETAPFVAVPAPYAWAAFLVVMGLVLGCLTLVPLVTALARRAPDAWRVGVEWVEPLEATGTLIRYLGRAKAIVVVVPVVSGAFGVLVVVLPFAGLTWFDDGELLVPWAVSLLLVAAGGWQLVEMIRGRTERGWLALTPEGVVHRSQSTDAFVPWDNVAFVFAERIRTGSPGLRVPFLGLAVADPSHSQVVRRARAIRGHEDYLAPHVAVRPGVLAIDPGVLYHALRFYLENPDARPELDNDAALRRLYQADFGAAAEA